MDWNNSDFKDFVIETVRTSFTRLEVVGRVSAEAGEAVSYEALRSAWKRWRHQDRKLKKIQDLLGLDVLGVLADTVEPPSHPRPPKSASRYPNPRAEVEDLDWTDMPFKAGKVYKAIVIPDMQVPYHDKKALKAVEAYMADETWDEYINLGDFMDMDHISSHSKGNLRSVEGKTLNADYAVGNQVLDRHQEIIRKRNKDARFVLLEGNHDFRVERYIDEHPQLRGQIEVEKGLRLKERGFKWVRCYANGDLYKLGKAYFHHGLYHNANHTKTMADRFGVNIFYGHVHDVQQHAKVIWGKDKTVVGQSMGCLCDYEQSYIKQNPTNWQHALGVFYFTDDGNFTYYVPRIIDYKFVAPNGRIYDGNKL